MNRDTGPIGIGQMEDDGVFAVENLWKYEFLLKDDPDFAKNQSISPSLYPCPSVKSVVLLPGKFSRLMRIKRRLRAVCFLFPLDRLSFLF